jgi:hypothetical protein
LDGTTSVTSSPWMPALLMMPIARCEVATHTTHEVPNFIVMDTVVIREIDPAACTEVSENLLFVAGGSPGQGAPAGIGCPFDHIAC